MHPVRVNSIQCSTSTCSYLGSSSPLVAGVKVGLRKTPLLSLSILQYNYNYEPPNKKVESLILHVMHKALGTEDFSPNRFVAV